MYTDLVNEIQDVLNTFIPSSFHTVVREYKILGDTQISIKIASSDKCIHGVSEQWPDYVSLCLEPDTWTLQTQIYGGNGGGSIYITPDPTNPRERFLSLARVKIPFRKPKQEKKFVMKAIKTFCERYIQTLKDNRERLHYPELSDYSVLD